MFESFHNVGVGEGIGGRSWRQGIYTMVPRSFDVKGRKDKKW